MKKQFILSSIILLIFVTFTNALCNDFAVNNDPAVEKAKANLKDAKCKADALKSINENSDNTIALAVQVGMKKDYEMTWKKMTDSLTSCDSINILWDEFHDRLDKKTK
jgi:hypothetical protein